MTPGNGTAGQALPVAAFVSLAGRRARTAGSALSRVPLAMVRRWRRSLQLRVVVSTLVASALVVVLLGLVLLNQIAGGLLTAKRTAAISEASYGLSYARLQLSAVGSADDPGLKNLSVSVAGTLQSRGASAGLYGVYLSLPASSNTEAVATGNVEKENIPTDLRQLVQLGDEGYRYVSLRQDGQPSTPGLVVGGPINTTAGVFELYYVFPLTTEVQTLALVRRTLFFAGLVLVLLLAAVAGIVARQVVSPVRIAARTAADLAAGLLTERMRVRGEDDLARLATSFNDMADSLQRQIAQLEELSRVQRRFTSDVSHELRTPLTTVRMAADMLYAAREDFAPEAARSAELLQAEVDRFEALLVDLLEISRYDAGAARLETEPTDLAGLVRRAVTDMAPVIDRAGSEAVLDLPSTPVIAEVDPRRVERVLRNLLGNAADHGEGGPIEVVLAGDADTVAITVRDHGVGLRPGESSLVFSRFWRADPSRTRQTGGTGLGLSISLEDARLHGGWLQAWGEPGEGAQFRLTVPRHAGAHVVRSPLPLSPEPSLAPSTPKGSPATAAVNQRAGRRS